MHITIQRTQLSGSSILNYQKMLKIVDFMKFSFWLFFLVASTWGTFQPTWETGT